MPNIDASKGDDCPNGWSNITSPVAACRAPSDNAGCYSAQFLTHQVPYSRVCGMVIGYHYKTCDAFLPGSNFIDDPYVDGISITYGSPRKHIWTYAVGGTEAGSTYSCPCAQNPVCGMVIGYHYKTCDAFLPGSNFIDDPYVDGISITYGSPRKHIWTYAVGGTEAGSIYSCPCAQNPGPLPPAFVHENYYCEPGSSLSDPVWDGEDCFSKNSCCSEPNLPWFYHQIPLTSDKDREARICRDQHFGDEGVFVKEIKLYVQ